ncbi:hypothetical protein AB0D49_10315 [Streptomyces sp. NPDC048290]|uniref:hypothetical protein n=1 Tax=Streptomyces sp. NPDC048290 TaxID=3155811 RepID=UPI00343D82D1
MNDTAPALAAGYEFSADPARIDTALGFRPLERPEWWMALESGCERGAMAGGTWGGRGGMARGSDPGRWGWCGLGSVPRGGGGPVQGVTRWAGRTARV